MRQDAFSVKRNALLPCSRTTCVQSTRMPPPATGTHASVRTKRCWSGHCDGWLYPYSTGALRRRTTALHQRAHSPTDQHALQCLARVAPARSHVRQVLLSSLRVRLRNSTASTPRRRHAAPRSRRVSCNVKTRTVRWWSGRTGTRICNSLRHMPQSSSRRPSK